MAIFKEQDIFAGRYQLVKHLGSGGFAEVWKAKDLMADNVELAVKIYAPERGLDEQGVRLFRKEYSNTVRLNHSHLLIPKHFDVHEGSPYLIMPYCPGGNLMDRIIDEKKFTEKELLGVFTPLVEALTYLHGKEVIHQDIKPHNILLDEDGQYVLADFGISGRMRRTIAARTQMANKQTASFTPAYAPPERITSKPSPEWDIFSLGVTMYELATGDLPFEDTGLALSHDSSLPELPAPWSKKLSDVLSACMAKSPTDRPKAKDLLAQLRSFQSGSAEPVIKKKTPRRKTEVYHAPVEAEKEAPTTTKPVAKRKIKPWGILLGMLVLALASGLPSVFKNIKKQAQKKETYRKLNQEAATHLNNKEFRQALSKYDMASLMMPDEFEPQQGKRNVAAKAADYYLGRSQNFRKMDEYNLAIENADSALAYRPGAQNIISLKDSLFTERIGNSLIIGDTKPLTDLVIGIDKIIKETVPADINVKDYEIVDKDGNQLTIRRIKKDGKFGFINALNQIIVQPVYDELYPYAGGIFKRARFKKNDKFGYLDILGKEIIPAKFAAAEDFKGTKARVSYSRIGALILDNSPDFGKEGFAFFIDLNGNRIN